MQDEQQEKQPIGVWILVIVCSLAIVFTLASGAAYAGVNEARLTAAKASVGQIESVFYLAERTVRDDGHTPPEGSYDNLLKSYDDETDTLLSEYERALLDAMLLYFGAGRDFDFAVTRFEDGSGSHTRVYYFPVKGRTDLGRDPYYMTLDGQLTQEGK